MKKRALLNMLDACKLRYPSASLPTIEDIEVIYVLGIRSFDKASAPNKTAHQWAMVKVQRYLNAVTRRRI